MMNSKNNNQENPWENIAKVIKENGLNLKKISPESKARWGLDFTGNYLMVWELSKVYDENHFKKIRGNFSELIKVSVKNHNDKTHLIIRLTNIQQWSIFKSFCLDLIESIDKYADETNQLEEFKFRLLNWKKFWKKAKNDILEKEQIKGLIGELYFLKEYLFKKTSPSNALRSWVGHAGHPQDFSYNNNCYEIKVHDESISQIKISSKEQLTQNSNNLYLVTYSVAASKEIGSINLINLIRSIKEMLDVNEAEILETQLANVGYSYNKKYEEHSYIISTPKFFNASNEDFPKITSSMVNSSITELNYKIPIEVLQRFLIKENEIEL